MSSGPPTGVQRGPVAVVTAVAGPTESVVAGALSGRRDLVLVRRCADVAELLSVTEAGLAVVAVVGESFPGLDADVVDRVRLNGCLVLGVVDPDRESSERLRAWAVPVVDVDASATEPAVTGTATGPTPGGRTPLALAVLAALGAGPPGGSGPVGAGAHAGGPDPAAEPRAADPRAADPAADPGAADPGAANPGAADPGAADPGAADPGGAAGGTAPAAARTGGYSDPAGPAGPRPVRTVAAGRGPRGADATAGHRGGVGTVEGVPVDPVHGRLVAVWGPAGAPGRTTVAVGVAAELAASGAQVLLVDADTYAASVAQVLGMLDEAPGLVAAVRAGLDGRLDPDVLARLAPEAAPGLRVLTGLTRAARWSELRPAGLQAVWSTARRLVDFVVVDLASPLEEDDELSYDTAAPRRNGAAVEVLRAADDVLVVGSADPVGLQRLVRGLQDLAVVAPGVRPRVLVNRLRADAVGRNPRLRVREALQRFAGVDDPLLVPDDRPATDRALLSGRTLVEATPASPARAALRRAAEELSRQAGRPVPARTRRRVATRG